MDFELGPDVRKAIGPLLGRHPVETGCRVSRCLDGSLGVGYLLLAGDLFLFGDRRVGSKPSFRAASVRAIGTVGVEEVGLDAFGRIRFGGDETVEIPLSLFDMAPYKAFAEELRERMRELSAERAATASRDPGKDGRPRAPFTTVEEDTRPPPPPPPRREGRRPRVKLGRVSGSRCPHCRRELVWSRSHETVVEVCLTCKGCLVSAEAVAHLAKRPDAVLSHLPPGTTHCSGCSQPARPDDSFCGVCGTRLGLDCPACRDLMRTVMVGQVEVDLCCGCSAVWLDQGEARDVAKGPPLGTPCVGCSTPLGDPDQAYLGERGPLCPKCHRSGEFEDWIQRKTDDEYKPVREDARGYSEKSIRTRPTGGLALLEELVQALVDGLD